MIRTNFSVNQAILLSPETSIKTSADDANENTENGVPTDALQENVYSTKCFDKTNIPQAPKNSKFTNMQK